jgi:formylglycine-generating enzyme required for sulfatase activity
MVYIPGGTFEMGDNLGDGWAGELPVHTVTLDSFCMGKYEVTNRQYCDYLNSALSEGLITVSSGGIVYQAGSGTSYGYCDTSTSTSYSQIAYSAGVFSVRTKSGRDMSNDPMVVVSWYGAAAYCNRRSQEEGYETCYDPCDPNWPSDFSKKGYRLATEAEWEYAARGGLSGKRFPWGDTISHSQANYYACPSCYTYDVSPTEGYHPTWDDGVYPYTSPMGSFAANGYGLYDMAGNVWEWCNDCYSSSYYSSSPTDNPTGPISGAYRVIRGGRWFSGAIICRVAYRYRTAPADRYGDFGFRCVLDF